MKILALIIATVFAVGIKAQTYKGNVKDAQTGEPLPMVNVCVKGTTMGTITNMDGNFSLYLPQGHLAKKLSFSCIGYKTAEIILQKKTLQIVLAPSNTQIAEIKVMPDSNLFTLLKSAYKRIPENFGKEPSMLTGFVQSSKRVKDSSFLYVVEGLIDSYKTSYRYKTDGQVKVIKSRKNMLAQVDSFHNKRYYGSFHIAHSGDVVKERYGAIAPSNFKYYTYNYEGVTAYDGQQVYVFDFVSISGKLKGRFYIEKESLAYVAYQYEKKGKWLKEDDKEQEINFSRGFVQYARYEGRWYLKNRIDYYESTDLKTKAKLISTLDYVTTHVGFTHVKPIPYDEQLKYGEVVTSVTPDYSDSYWSETTVLTQDTASKINIEALFNKQGEHAFLVEKSAAEKEVNLKREKIEKLDRIFSRLSGDLIFEAKQMRISALKTAVDIGGQNISVQVKAREELADILGYNYAYDVYRGYNVALGAMLSVTKQYYVTNFHFGFYKEFCIKPGGRQLFLRTSLLFCKASQGVNLFDSKLKNKVSFEGATFGEESEFSLINKGWDAEWGLQLKASLTHRLHLLVGGHYSNGLSKETCILINQGKSIFSEEKTIKLTKELKTPIQQVPLFFSLGLSYTLR
jgi:hypothetical protein